MLWPQYQKFGEARWQVKMNKSDRDNQEEYYSHLENLSKDLTNYQEQISKIITAIPSGSDIPALLNFLSNAGNKNGMSFKKINSFSVSQFNTGNRPDQIKAVSNSAAGGGSISPRLKEIFIDFDVGGEYKDFKNFISTLEKSARMIEIESISLKRGITKLETGNELTFNFKIKTFYY